MYMPRHAKAYKFKRTVSQIEEPFQSENLDEFKFVAALTVHEVKAQDYLILLKFIFEF